MNDQIPKIAAVLNTLVHAAKMQAKFPLPVWDDTGTLIGVSISTDKKMGPQDCVAEATFVLNPLECDSPEKIKAKAELAINALKSEVLVSIRPKKRKVA